MRCLEIGGGPSPQRPDWEQLDLQDWSHRGNPTTHIADMRRLPFRPDTFDEMLACNVLEHVQETQHTLAEWARVLKPGGRLTLIVPDAVMIIGDYHRGITSWAECSERLCGSQSYDADVHRAAFTTNEMGSIIESAGLRVLRVTYDHKRSGIYAEAIKDAATDGAG